MVNILITEKITKNSFSKNLTNFRFVATRKIAPSEIRHFKENQIHRYFVPRLGEKEKREFFKEFDKFWLELIAPFNREHCFWRRSIASKMQEWEFSFGYFIMVLYALMKVSEKEDLNFIFLCKEEEKKFIYDWAINRNWNVLNYSESKLRKIISSHKIKNFLLYCRQVLALFYKKIYSPCINIESLKKEYTDSTLIASLFYPHSFKENKYYDPFWGNLGDLLRGAGKNYLYVADSLVRLNRLLVKKIKGSKVILPYSLMRWKDVFSCAFIAPFKRIKIPPCYFYGQDFSGLAEKYTNIYYGRLNFLSESFFCSFDNLCAKVQFSEFLVIYEGNILERACMQAFRKNSVAPIKGYAQGVTYDLSLKLRRATGEEKLIVEPDIYLSTGPYAGRLFAKVGNRSMDMIKDGCSLRYIPQETSQKVRTGNRYILIALDGVNSSVSVLDWICENQNVFSGYDVIVRGHPNVPIDELRQQIVEDIPASFELSKKTLKEDIERCFCVVYRQTSVGMQGLLNGKPVIQLALDSPFSGDPMDELTDGKWVVRNSSEMREVLDEVSQLKEKEIASFIPKAKEFVSNYFAQPTDVNLAAFIGQ